MYDCIVLDAAQRPFAQPYKCPAILKLSVSRVDARQATWNSAHIERSLHIASLRAQQHTSHYKRGLAPSATSYCVEALAGSLVPGPEEQVTDRGGFAVTRSELLTASTCAKNRLTI